MTKPTLESAVGKFLHCDQHRGISPNEVDQEGFVYQDLDEGGFTPLHAAWGATYTLSFFAECSWGHHSFLIGPKGVLTFASSCWDSSG
jgi:hypothetical protein